MIALAPGTTINVITKTRKKGGDQLEHRLTLVGFRWSPPTTLLAGSLWLIGNNELGRHTIPLSQILDITTIEKEK